MTTSSASQPRRTRVRTRTATQRHRGARQGELAQRRPPVRLRLQTRSEPSRVAQSAGEGQSTPQYGRELALERAEVERVLVPRCELTVCCSDRSRRVPRKIKCDKQVCLSRPRPSFPSAEPDCDYSPSPAVPVLSVCTSERPGHLPGGGESRVRTQPGKGANRVSAPEGKGPNNQTPPSGDSSLPCPLPP